MLDEEEDNEGALLAEAAEEELNAEDTASD